MNDIFFGDCRAVLKRLRQRGVAVQTCITSPPYFGLRAYTQSSLEIGIEPTVSEYVDSLVDVFALVWDLLADDGILWLNLGDSYASFRDGKVVPDSSRRGDLTAVPKGLARNRMKDTFRNTDVKHKDLIGIPWEVAFALRRFGWYLRQDNVWSKPNPKTESVQDRATKSHEYVFMLTKSEKYFYDKEAATEQCVSSDAKKNRRSVWTIPTQPQKGHAATFPKELVRPLLLTSTQQGDIVLDPFMGTGTVAQVAAETHRLFVGCELNHDNLPLQRQKLDAVLPNWTPSLVKHQMVRQAVQYHRDGRCF